MGLNLLGLGRKIEDIIGGIPGDVSGLVQGAEHLFSPVEQGINQNVVQPLEQSFQRPQNNNNIFTNPANVIQNNPIVSPVQGVSKHIIGPGLQLTDNVIRGDFGKQTLHGLGDTAANAAGGLVELGGRLADPIFPGNQTLEAQQLSQGLRQAASDSIKAPNTPAGNAGYITGSALGMGAQLIPAGRGASVADDVASFLTKGATAPKVVQKAATKGLQATGGGLGYTAASGDTSPQSAAQNIALGAGLESVAPAIRLAAKGAQNLVRPRVVRPADVNPNSGVKAPVQAKSGQTQMTPVAQTGTPLSRLEENVQQPSSAGTIPQNKLSDKATAVARGDALPQKLSDSERQKIIENSQWQQTKNQIELNPGLGNTRAAIAEATGHADEYRSRLDYAQHLAKQLDDHDQMLLSERGDPNVEVRPHDSKAFTKAAAATDDAFDYELAAKRAAGDPTLRYGSGKFFRLFFKATPQKLEEMGVPRTEWVQKGKSVGFVDEARKYRSYADAKAQAGLEPLNKTRAEDLKLSAERGYTGIRNNLLRESLGKSNPTEVADVGLGYGADGERFRQAANANLPFNVSKSLDKHLTNFQGAWQPKTKVGRGAEKTVSFAGKATKKVLFLGSTFHQAHITENVGIAHLVGGERKAFSEGLLNEFKTKGGLSKGSWHEMLNHYSQDGTTEFARSKMGIVISDGSSALQRFVDSYALSLAKMARKGGIDPETAVDLGAIYNRILGRDNAAVEARNPTLEKMTSYFALAPHYLRTQLRLVWDAFAPKKLGGAGYDKPLDIKTPGGAARSTVIGSRAIGALFTITASAIVMNRFPSWQDAVNEAGLNPNNPVPNIDLNTTNAKGEKQVMNIPTDPAGLAALLATSLNSNDPGHFFQSRYSPLLGFATRVVTNRDWNGNPIADPTQPGYGVKLVAGSAAGNLPIGLQNLTKTTGLPGSSPTLTPLEGAAQNFLGGRVKTNPNDPQVQANQKFAQDSNMVTNILKSGKFSQLDPSLQDDPQYAAYWADQYAKLHPKDMTGPGGVKFAEPFNPNSSLLKYQAYSAVDANGKPVLSPVFYADKQRENSTPGYPSSPLYKLDGSGISANGDEAPKALVAMQYQFNQDPGAKQALMNANGGRGGWLAEYENQAGDYSQNYQQNLTNYFKGLGWSDQAVNDFWAKHPSSPDPIENLNFSPSTTSLINQYEQISASDPSAGAKFFTDNVGVLGDAFDRLAQHANAVRQARGELQLQGYPQESARVKQILDSMPQGSDKASKKARAIAIQSNPDVNQYLANVALYETLSKGAQFRYKNPSDMTATEGQNVNSGGQAGQTFLKDVTSLGNYDIGPAPGGGLAFMQGGSLPQGSNSQVAFNKQKAYSASRRSQRALARSFRHSNSSSKIHLKTGKAYNRLAVKGTHIPKISGVKKSRPKVSLKTEMV